MYASQRHSADCAFQEIQVHHMTASCLLGCNPEGGLAYPYDQAIWPPSWREWNISPHFFTSETKYHAYVLGHQCRGGSLSEDFSLDNAIFHLPFTLSLSVKKCHLVMLCVLSVTSPARWNYLTWFFSHKNGLVWAEQWLYKRGFLTYISMHLCAVMDQ